MSEISRLPLLQALSNMLGVQVSDVAYESELLQGGDVGEVSKISGQAFSNEGSYPFSLVLKKQQKWDRHGDPECWRREYEIYRHGLDQKLLQTIKLPRCYLLQESGDLTQIWMEYIEGKTGDDLIHAPELALAAERLGKLQADFHKNGKHDLPFLRSYPAVRSSFDLWWGDIKKELGTEIEDFPEELRHTLNDFAARAESLLDAMDKLPLTICQGDFYHDNIIFKPGLDGTDIYVIDWDCAGYGRMGEDAVDILMEAFVYSDRDVSLMPDFKKCIIDGYLRGVQSGGMDFTMNEALVRDIFALAWGFRITDQYLYHLHYKDEQAKERCIAILRTMFMGSECEPRV
ncbi:MAG: aminoglycoside phosphotransferase family protein [Firmicutes bacterium]|nr:aminoglycoside phosphotransferase family protein [Bacillota bacterium]